MALRLLAFKQVYKVLGMEPIVPQQHHSNYHNQYHNNFNPKFAKKRQLETSETDHEGNLISQKF
jgi:hypothetical protein